MPNLYVFDRMDQSGKSAYSSPFLQSTGRNSVRKIEAAILTGLVCVGKPDPHPVWCVLGNHVSLHRT